MNARLGIRQMVILTGAITLIIGGDGCTTPQSWPTTLPNNVTRSEAVQIITGAFGPQFQNTSMTFRICFVPEEKHRVIGLDDWVSCDSIDELGLTYHATRKIIDGSDPHAPMGVIQVLVHYESLPASRVGFSDVAQIKTTCTHDTCYVEFDDAANHRMIIFQIYNFWQDNFFAFSRKERTAAWERLDKVVAALHTLCPSAKILYCGGRRR